MSQPDRTDDVLSDYFKSKLRHPWPPAPATAHAEPARAPAAAGQGTRARVTLAASVALLLGTCWYLSNGTPTAGRAAPQPGVAGGIDLGKGTATQPKEFEKKVGEIKMP